MPRNSDRALERLPLTEGPSDRHPGFEWESLHGMWVRIEWTAGPITPSWSGFCRGLLSDRSDLDGPADTENQGLVNSKSKANADTTVRKDVRIERNSD